jgi:hypothetical protein
MRWPRVNPEDLRSLESCRGLLSMLFKNIQERYGEMTACRLFAPYATPLSASDRKNLDLLVEYYIRKKPLKTLAKELAEENKKLPRNERHGPRGTTDSNTMKNQIKRLLKRRDAGYERHRARLVGLWIEKFSYDPTSGKYVTPDDIDRGTF